MNPDDPKQPPEDAAASVEEPRAEDREAAEEAPAPAAAPAAPKPAPPPPPADAGPGPRRAALFHVGLLACCLLVGIVSLVSGPYAPEAEMNKDEYEIFGPTDVFTAGLRPDGVAVVRVDGGIQFESPTFSGPKNADRAVDLLRKVAKASSVKAVVLRVNSPGGTVAASQEIADAVRLVRKAGKKVVVSMADMAASGGYYISAPSDYIYAHRGTITGSIGVITQLPRYKEIADKIGYDVVSFTSGPFKDMGNPFREMGDEEGGLFKKLVMDAYLQFVEEVARGRAPMILAKAAEPKDSDAWDERLKQIRAGEDDRPRHPPGEEKKETGPGAADASENDDASTDSASDGDGDKPDAPKAEEDIEDVDMAAVRRRVAELADGRIYTGEEALRLGLVDEIGGLKEAIRKAGEMAGLGPDPVLLVPRAQGDLGQFFSLMGKAPTDLVDSLAERLRTSLGAPPTLALPASVPVAYLYLPGR